MDKKRIAQIQVSEYQAVELGIQLEAIGLALGQILHNQIESPLINQDAVEDSSAILDELIRVFPEVAQEFGNCPDEDRKFIRGSNNRR